MPSKLYHNVRPRKEKLNDAPWDGKPGSVINASTRKENYLATGKVIPRACSDSGGNYFPGIELNNHDLTSLASRELVFSEL